MSGNDSVNNGNGEETSSDSTITANHWVKRFEQFKNERGEWLHDQSFLEWLRQAFRDDKKFKKTDSADSEEEEIEEEKSDGEEEEEENGFWPKDSFMGKLQDFTDAARDFLMTRSTTLTARDHPYRPTQPDLLFYDEFRSYLMKHRFSDKMVDVLVKMFGMHPELPERPLEFIRDNFGISKKDEDKLVAEWVSVTNEITRLREEAKILEERITRYRVQPSLESSSSDGSTGDGRSNVSRMIMQRQNEMYTDEKSLRAKENVMPFHDEETDTSSEYDIQPSSGSEMEDAPSSSSSSRDTE